MSRIRFSRIAAVLLAIPALHVASTYAAPGDPDAGFGSFGVATATSTTSGDFAYDATGAGLRYVTGGALRGWVTHLFLARHLTDGSLDATFGSAGRTMLRLDHASEGRAVREQPDGKLVVVGTHYVPNAYEVLVARFNADGTPDTTFATNGVYTRRVGSFSYGAALALQSDGKIVVAGTSAYVSNSTYDMVVLRLNADGTADSTFGTGGLKTLDFRGGFDNATAVAVTSTGKILVSGGADSGPLSTPDFAIAQLNADGSNDTAFGPVWAGGLVTVDVGGGYDFAHTMSLDVTGIWLAGMSIRSSDGRYVFSVARLLPSGTPDTYFGGTGTAMASPSPSQAFAYRIALAPGKITVGGTTNGRFAMVRYTYDGVLDATFGAGGIVLDTVPVFSGMAGLANEGAGILAVASAPEAANPLSYDVVRVLYTSFGALDTAFGSGGKVLTNLFDLSWDIRAASVTPDGKIFAAGALYDAFDWDFAALRLNASGNPDTGFGRYGVATVGFGKGDDRASAMLVRSDGKVVLGGRNNIFGTSSFALTRLTAVGQVDTTFGTGGRTTHVTGIGFGEITALATTAGGKIVAAGYALVGSGNYDFTLARYTESGLLDGTFGTGGMVITPFGADSDVAHALAVQPDGKIVVAGYTRASNLFDFAVARYNADGTPDAGFGAGGKVTVVVGASNDQAHGLALQPDGKILVAGEVFGAATNNDMAIIRLHSNGGLDSTFGTSGIATVNFTGGADAAWALALQPNGKLVAAGTASDGPARAFALARLNPDGSRDAGFGAGYAGGGLETTDITGSLDTAFAVALQRDGKIVSAGVAGTQWAVTRHLGDPPFKLTDLNGDGKSDLLYRNVATGQVYRMLMNGVAIAGAAVAYTEPNTAWKIVGDADFDGDGVTDLLWRSDATGQVYLQPFGANGIPSGGAVIYTEPNASWKIVATPDFDGDAKADILWWNSLTGQVYALRMNGYAILAQALFYTEPNTNWRIVAVGDFAGSGKRNQLVWRNLSTGQVFVMTVGVTGSAFTQTGAMIYRESNTAWKIVAAADFNGDGKSDLLWRNDATGQVYVLLMNGAAITSEAAVYSEPNLAWKIVSQGDYNGDGKADLLWRNESNGQVFIFLMNGLSIAAQALVYTEPNVNWKLLGPWEYGQP